MKMPNKRPRRETHTVYIERDPARDSHARINALAKKWQMQGANKGTQQPSKLITDEYNYSTPIVTLPANGFETVYIAIEPDAQFQIAKLMWYGQSVSWTRGNAPVMLEIFDTASGLELMRPTVSTSFAGSGNIAAVLPQIKNLAAKQMLGVRMRNMVTETVTAQLTLGGRKVFNSGY